MKAICQREGFLAKFQLVSSAVPSKDIKPILNNLKAIADAQQSCCTLMATDLEVGIRLDVQGLTIEEEGEAILPAQHFLRILRESQSSELTIEANSDQCVVQGTNMYFEMPSEDAGNFPDIPTFDSDDYFEISSTTLREMIRRTIFATAGESSARPAMSGVLFDIQGESLKLVATDGRRLALSQGEGQPHGNVSSEGQNAIVPPKALALLERNLQDDGETMVRIGLRANEVLFRTELATIYSVLFQGRFPDYQSLFKSQKDSVTVPLEVGSFHAAVRQAAIMSDEESKRVDFQFDDNALTLKAKGARSGRSQVEMPMVYDAKKISIGFNPQYLTDMLRILPPESEIHLEMVDGSKPALFRSGAGYSYMVMPYTS